MRNNSPSLGKGKASTVKLKVGGENWRIKFSEAPQSNDYDVINCPSRKIYIDLSQTPETVQEDIWKAVLYVCTYYSGNNYQEEQYVEEDWVRKTAPLLSNMIVQNRRLFQNILDIDNPPKGHINTTNIRRKLKAWDDTWTLKTKRLDGNEGETHFTIDTIYINPNSKIHVAEVRNTILHEILHVCGFYGGINYSKKELFEEEEWIEAVHKTLANIMTQNKNLIYMLMNSMRNKPKRRKNSQSAKVSEEKKVMVSPSQKNIFTLQYHGS